MDNKYWNETFREQMPPMQREDRIGADGEIRAGSWKKYDFTHHVEAG